MNGRHVRIAVVPGSSILSGAMAGAQLVKGDAAFWGRARLFPRIAFLPDCFSPAGFAGAVAGQFPFFLGQKAYGVKMRIVGSILLGVVLLHAWAGAGREAFQVMDKWPGYYQAPGLWKLVKATEFIRRKLDGGAGALRLGTCVVQWMKQAGVLDWARTANSFEATSVLGAGQACGYYSLHQYIFRSWMLFDEDSVYKDGGNAECSMSIMWPGPGLGLPPERLARLRWIILSRLWSMNGYLPFPGSISSTGEMLEVEIRKIAEAMYKESVQFVKNEVQPQKAGEAPGICMEYFVDGRLDCPFGVGGRRDLWYGHPVICMKFDEYDNFGGSGCHSYVHGFIFSIPEGKILTIRDYLDEGKINPDLYDLLKERMVQKHGAFDLSDDSIQPEDVSCVLVSEEGMTWWLRPYTAYCGSYGPVSVTIPWKDLEPLARRSVSTGTGSNQQK